jgi:hypothetical protein
MPWTPPNCREQRRPQREKPTICFMTLKQICVAVPFWIPDRLLWIKDLTKLLVQFLQLIGARIFCEDRVRDFSASLIGG